MFIETAQPDLNTDFSRSCDERMYCDTAWSYVYTFGGTVSIKP